ncbi:hypothetical protein ACO0LL_07185 [Undibacterium sp. TC4M20W]|uniref:type IVB secretion system protein IcmW n=1 Tax=Undibacterium sp. TC4M20W TaxID=3413052 RepID=UPI003BF1E086
MVDLTSEGLQAYWGEVSPGAPYIIGAMDATEDWVLDSGASLDDEMAVLVASMPAMLAQAVRSGQKAAFINDLLVVLAYLHSSLALRLVYWLETGFPEIEFNFLHEAQSLYEQGSVTAIDRVAFKLMMDRLRFARKTALLQTVFAPERLVAVKTAIEQGARVA